MLNASEILMAWNRAKRDAGIAGGARACARIYVAFYGLTPASRAALRRFCKSWGHHWTGAQGHVPNAIYVGYDNATGIEHGRAEAFARELQALGLKCYADAAED